jgi:hypothetical protein
MKKIILLSFFAIASFSFLNHFLSAPAIYSEAVNPLLGDAGYLARFGVQPGPDTDEDLRIRTHLEYVENLLRNKDASHLSPAMHKTRGLMLDLLREYHSAGVFPRNYDHPGKRRPCFIDKNGRICAVGYLVEKTAGRPAAAAINARHQYDDILDMDSDIVADWVASSGLTMEECAMIQPNYSFPVASPSDFNYISTAYGLSSAVLGGFNLSLNTVNAIQIATGTGTKTASIMGMASGAGQVILGAVMWPKEQTKQVGFNEYTFTNESQKTLSMINIGLGTATVALSVWNLRSAKNKSSKSSSWGLYHQPLPDNQMALGVSWSKTL